MIHHDDWNRALLGHEFQIQLPLDGITAAARELGQPLSTLQVGVRTGDTPTLERQRLIRKPPHILITTDENAVAEQVARYRCGPRYTGRRSANRMVRGPSRERAATTGLRRFRPLTKNRIGSVASLKPTFVIPLRRTGDFASRLPSLHISVERSTIRV